MKKALLLVSIFVALGNAEPKRRDIAAGWPWDTIPHVVDGSSWKTTITLVNLGQASHKYKIVFRSDDGALKSFAFSGRGSGDTFSGEIPRGGIAVFETAGVGSQLQSGWAELDILGTDFEIGLMAVFGTSGIPGRPDFEATVPGSTGVDYEGVLPFDNTRGYVTSVALLNPSRSTASTIPVVIYDENGGVLKNDSITLQAGRKIAFETNSRWPETAGRRGTIQFQGSLASWAVLGFRFHPGGSFTTVNMLEQ